jgi:hypothetical protein
MTTEIRELAVTNSLTDSYLILAECKDLKRSLSQELDLARDRRVQMEDEHLRMLAELRETNTQIQGQFQIMARLVNLIGGTTSNAGDRRQKTTEVQTSGVSSFRH